MEQTTLHYRIISPQTSFWQTLNLAELWRCRELLYFLAWREIKVRYKQAALGISWALIQPLAAMLIFTLFFGKIAKMPSDGLPYPVFSYSAMLLWTYFTSALGKGSNSLVGGSALYSKIYFPRLIIPISAILPALVEYLIAFLVLIPLLFYYHVTLSWAVLVFVPLFTVMATALALGLSLWLSALNVKYRDVSHVLPFLIQLWMYATPIVFPLSFVPEKYRIFVKLNPMTGIIEGFRKGLVTSHFDWWATSISALAIVVTLAGGAFYFGRTEKSMVDLV